MYKKSPESFSLDGSSTNTPTPFKCFYPPENQTFPNDNENQ